MARVRVILPDLSLKLDLRLVAQHAGMAMRDYWADRLDAGEQPDGRPLPLNAKGEPLGRGQGTLIKKWVIKSMGRKARLGRAYVQPYGRGKYKHAIWALAKRGLEFQSFAGASAKAWEVIGREVAEDAIAEAITKTKRKRRRRVRRWSPPAD